MDMKRERHFSLHVMRFVFNISGHFFPPDLQKKLDELPEDEGCYFTENVSRASVIIITNESDVDPPVEIDSELFEYKVDALRRKFEIEKLHEFCLIYFRKSLRDKYYGRVNSPYKVLDSILNVLEYAKSVGVLTSASWEELDYYAYNLIVTDRKRSKANRRNEFDEMDTVEQMRAEELFILRIVDYVFLLHFKAIPLDLEAAFWDLEGFQDLHFTPNVVTALVGILNYQIPVSKRLTEAGLEEYYQRVSFNFEEKEFLEACVCYSKKAMRDYYEDCYSKTPLKVYKFLVNTLRYAREQRVFTSWDSIEYACIEIIKDEEGRSKWEEGKYQIASRGNEALADFASHSESGSGTHLLGSEKMDVGEIADFDFTASGSSTQLMVDVNTENEGCCDWKCFLPCKEHRR